MIYGTDFNAVDIGALVLILLEMFLGLRRGLAGTLFRLMCTLAILLFGLRFYQPFGSLLAEHTTRLADNPDMAGALAFLLILVVLGLCFLLLRWLLRVLMTVTFNEKINSPGGGVVGVFQGLALVFLLVYAMGLWPQPAWHQLFVQNSLVGRTVVRLYPRMISVVEQVEFRAPPPFTTLEKSGRLEKP
ncbi:MAG: CvpA family protein [Verrucomicrobia bacterium]|nr:CvpA family protein [Verrucomicrobiota bacterium]MBU4429240.1 CvpA family protein [Verrucomicrobiota bacterium]MCG2680371.1 CvpA family protein [Kiritimatiellia bacterium]